MKHWINSESKKPKTTGSYYCVICEDGGRWVDELYYDGVCFEYDQLDMGYPLGRCAVVTHWTESIQWILPSEGIKQ